MEELETVRLVDLLDLDQEEAAFYMGISRKAFWNDLMNARRKIAAALVYGMGLRIEGGSFALRGEEASTTGESQEHLKEMALMEREIALLGARLEHLSSRVASLKGKDMADSGPASKLRSISKGADQ